MGEGRPGGSGRPHQPIWEALGLLLWLFQRDLKVSLGSVQWYRSSDGTDVDNSETLVSKTGAPESTPIYYMILVAGPPKKGPLILGKPQIAGPVVPRGVPV